MRKQSSRGHQEIKMASVKRRQCVVSLPEVNWAPRNYLGHLLKMCNEFETNMSGLQVTAMVMFTGYSVASDHMVRNTLN